MSKLSVADLRGILSRIFEHLSVIKIKQVSRFFFVQKQEILYNNLFYFTRNKLWWWTNNTPSVCLLPGATRGFCLTRIFCQILENLYLVWQTEVKNKTWSKLVRLWPYGLCSTMPDFIRSIKLKSKLNPCRLGKLKPSWYRRGQHKSVALLLLESHERVSFIDRTCSAGHQPGLCQPQSSLSSLSKYRQVIYFQSVGDLRVSSWVSNFDLFKQVGRLISTLKMTQISLLVILGVDKVKPKVWFKYSL